MKTKISALMDGELDERSARDAIATAAREGEAAEAWRTYHLIGDTMRGTRLLSEDFSERLAERLAAEPTVLAPKRVDRQPSPRSWFAMSAAASVAAVAMVGWVAFAPPPEPAPGPASVAAVPMPMPVAANDYLLAHQAFSPRVSLQGMAPYVRSVASEK